MKTPRFSKLTIFLAGTTLALLLVFGIQSLVGTDRLSDSVAGVGKGLLPDALAGFGSNAMVDGLYGNYSSWPHSANLKADDTTAQALSVLTQTYNGGNYFTLSDINGDGLVDILYHRTGGTSWYSYGIFLNNGSLGFTWAYKCVQGSNAQFYGDCAAI